jgi:hypothetical protein
MAYFQTKNPNWVNFVGRVSQWKMLVYLMALWSATRIVLWPFGIFHGHLVHFSRFGMLCQDKSGNPDTLSH